MRRIALVLAASCASVPTFAADAAPAPIAAPAAASDAASDADVDRLFQALDMKSTMDEMMQRMVTAQQAMVEEAFGKEMSEADRTHMHDLMGKTNAIMLRRMSWTALEPVMRKVYSQVFSKREVDAMIAFYSTPEGVSMLKKMPQAMTLSMQEMQPIVRDAMAEVKAMVDEEITAAKSRKSKQ